MMRNKFFRLLTVGLSMCFAFAGAGCGAGEGREASTLPEEANLNDIAKGSVNSGGSLHDPQVILSEDGTYYCYGTHMTAATSSDLIKWNSWADGVKSSNKIFDNLIAEPYDAFSFVGKNTENGYSVWAPSVIYNKTTGKYMMYF